MRKCFVGCGVLVFVSCLAHAATWYVDRDNVSGTENGTSWATAYNTIQEGIDAAFGAGGGEVWVAEGVYNEARTSPNADGSGLDTGSIVMKVGVHLYGGFAGTETARAERDWATRVTTLDGSTSRGGSPAFHVVVGANNATLDGFTVTGGNANGDGTINSAIYGGGMYNSSSSPTLTNCTFTANSAADGGGGMYNYSSSPTLTNCTFTANSASYGGGGMSNRNSSSPILTNCTFIANSASYGGGGMYNYSSSPTLTNCTFTENSASVGGGMFNDKSSSPTLANCTFTENTANYGGGMFNDSSSPTLTNCTFAANTASSGGGMSNYSSSPTLTNCIVWGNGTNWYDADGGTPVVTYSNIGTGYNGGGTGNISLDPLFVNADAGDFRLRFGSPCRDTGTTLGAPDADILGVPRPQGGGMDMGAFEFPIGGDTDGDGIPDLIEGNGDPDGDQIPNYLDLDSDNDGISDENEGITDPDGDGLENYLDPDSDGDTISDADEVTFGMNPYVVDNLDADPDGDGLSSRDEIAMHGTLPLNADSDNDGMPDGFEVDNSLDPLTDDAGSDADSDGLNNLGELNNGTGVQDPDSDDDGMADGFEVNNGLNPITNDAGSDADHDGLNNLGELNNGTGVQDPDTDDDGMADGFEVLHGLNPLINDAAGNPDNDAFTNGEEEDLSANYPVDPQDADLPASDWFVSAASVSDTNSAVNGGGTSQQPWRTIGKAMSELDELARASFPLRVLLDDTTNFTGDVGPIALYQEDPLTLISFVTVEEEDAADGLQVHIRPATTSNTPVIRGANHAALRNLIIRPALNPDQARALLEINDVSVTVENVFFDGLLRQNSTGIDISGFNSSDSIIRQCTFINLGTGIVSINSAVALSDNTFNNISANSSSSRAIAIGFTVLPGKQGGQTPVLGRSGRILETGFNRFRGLPAGAKAIEFVNVPIEITSAEYNDWGVYTEEAILARISSPVKVGEGSVDILPFIPEEKSIISGAITGVILDASGNSPIALSAAPTVIIMPPATAVLADADGIFTSPLLADGSYTLIASATRYEQSAPLGVALNVGRALTAPRFLLTGDSAELADINGDGKVDALDIQFVINAALGIDIGALSGDVNNDGKADALDIQLVINAALGST